jgi:hypothetical protein
MRAWARGSPDVVVDYPSLKAALGAGLAAVDPARLRVDGRPCGDLAVSLLVTLLAERQYRPGLYGARLALSGYAPAGSGSEPPTPDLGARHVLVAQAPSAVVVGGRSLLPALDGLADLVAMRGEACVMLLGGGVAAAASGATLRLPVDFGAISRGASARQTPAESLRPEGAWEALLQLAARLAALPFASTAAWFRRQLAIAARAERWFERAIAAGRPLSLTIHGGLDAVTHGFVAAAARAGLPRFELQHGALPLLSPYACAAPDGVFTPRSLLAWADNGLGAREYVIGAPSRMLHESLLARPETPEGADYARLREALAARLAGAPPLLLVTQQGGRGRDLVLPNAEGFTVWSRPHPQRQSARTPSPAAGFPLGLLLERASLHATRFSASALEAAAWGVPTYFSEANGPAIFPTVPQTPAIPRLPPRRGEAQSLAALPDRDRLLADLG